MAVFLCVWGSRVSLGAAAELMGCGCGRLCLMDLQVAGVRVRDKLPDGMGLENERDLVGVRKERLGVPLPGPTIAS